MANLCICGFDDIACDDFLLSDDDHTVPHSGSQKLGDCFILGESLEANICELPSSYSKINNRSSARRKAMSEKGSWSPMPDASFATASDSIPIKKPPNLASRSTVPLDHGLDSNNPCSDGSDSRGHDTFLSDMATMVDESFSYLPMDINQNSGDLDFSWPEIGSCEDIERILSCDSTFDFRVHEKDELSWASLADDLGDCSDLLKSDDTYPHAYMPSENTNPYRPSTIQTTVAANKDRFVLHGQINKNGDSDCTYHHPFPSIQRQRATQYPSNGHLQTPVSYVCSYSSHLSDPASVNTKPSTIKSETNHFHTSSRLSVDLKNESVTISDPGSVEKRVTQGRLGSSNVKESSKTSPGCNGVSLEASGFLQLQQVMQQLDFGTKLCMRDSLYRLAQSADGRNNHPGCENEGEAEGTNKHDNNMETNTNPIDRSMADLLFHSSAPTPVTLLQPS